MKVTINGLDMAKNDKFWYIVAYFKKIEGIWCKNYTWKHDRIWTVLIIERVLIIVSIAIMIWYSNYNTNVYNKI